MLKFYLCLTFHIFAYASTKLNVSSWQFYDSRCGSHLTFDLPFHFVDLSSISEHGSILPRCSHNVLGAFKQTQIVGSFNSCAAYVQMDIPGTTMFGHHNLGTDYRARLYFCHVFVRVQVRVFTYIGSGGVVPNVIYSNLCHIFVAISMSRLCRICVRTIASIINDRLVVPAQSQSWDQPL